MFSCVESKPKSFLVETLDEEPAHGVPEGPEAPAQDGFAGLLDDGWEQFDPPGAFKDLALPTAAAAPSPVVV